MYIDLEDVSTTLNQLASEVDRHYEEIIRIFDKGIDTLEKMDNEASKLKTRNTKNVPSPSSQKRALKRARAESTCSQPPAKRSNLS